MSRRQVVGICIGAGPLIILLAIAEWLAYASTSDYTLASAALMVGSATIVAILTVVAAIWWMIRAMGWWDRRSDR